MKTSLTPIEIIIADDQEIIRKGCCTLLQDINAIRIVAEASNGSDLLNLVERFSPDIVLTDIKMPGINGIEATAKIQQSFPQTAVIAFTMFSEDYLLIDMLEAGAMGYVLKDARLSVIVEAIESVNKSLPYYCADTQKKLKHLIDAKIYDPVLKIRNHALSNREKEVLILICHELSNLQIAQQLNISIKTVEVFRKKIYLKSNCKNMAGLVKYAINLGLFNTTSN